ncbi:hypothetical protein RND71_016451 [Anisodus tanguticus]|uniref:Uncharacterized protein n=1 Tax=Anisodus tanguticus TaxID=243964 RepID=A0AAE1VCS6_9SOLA|nr:hypothetical protein RND71_016451 [Anisodus tanguticus]
MVGLDDLLSASIKGPSFSIKGNRQEFGRNAVSKRDISALPAVGLHDCEILKATVLHGEMVVQGTKPNIVLCTNLIHEFCNECMLLEVGLLWMLEGFLSSSAIFIWFEKQKEESVLEVALGNEAFEEFLWVVNSDKEEHINTVVSV